MQRAGIRGKTQRRTRVQRRVQKQRVFTTKLGRIAATHTINSERNKVFKHQSVEV